MARAAAEMHINAELAGPDGYDPKAEQEEFRRIVKLKPSGHPGFGRGRQT
jgi:hypothetical protein